MPSLGADMDAGTLLEWKVAPGTVVHKGDIVAVVDTDKAAIDVEVFHDGIIDTLLVQPGTPVPVGTPLARLREADETAVEGEHTAPVAIPADISPRVAGPAASATAASAPPARTPPPDLTPDIAADTPPIHSPLVRRLAVQTGVDLHHVHPSGPGGLLTRADVEHAVRRPRVTPRARRLARALGVDPDGIRPAHRVVTGDDVLAAAQGVVPPAVTAVPPALAARPGAAAADLTAKDRHVAMRRAIAAAMSRSAREIPHYHLATTVDLQAATAWLRVHNADRPLTQRVLPAALLLRAAAAAARAVPESNGVVVDGTFQPAARVNLGVAVALRAGGLVAPAIMDADTLTLDELMAALRDLILRARRGGLRSSEIAEATITVTNLGDQGAQEVHGVIYPPQVALVGFGTITNLPVAVGDRVEIHPTTRATLAADHRVSDGLHGSRFLRVMQTALEHPEEHP